MCQGGIVYGFTAAANPEPSPTGQGCQAGSVVECVSILPYPCPTEACAHPPTGDSVGGMDGVVCEAPAPEKAHLGQPGVQGHAGARQTV